MSYKSNEDRRLWQSIIEHSQRAAGSNEALAVELGRLAVENGKASSKVNPKHIPYWHAGYRLFPLWARLAFLHYARDHGWQPKTDADADICYTLYLKAHPGASRSEFASDFNLPSR